ncbi:MAG: hypothetical protein OXT67_08330 [Zetaproteobacteria bacterium]|nr:hypothetical protein [Zetaproteobacteria bacterium]
MMRPFFAMICTLTIVLLPLQLTYLHFLPPLSAIVGMIIFRNVIPALLYGHLCGTLLLLRQSDISWYEGVLRALDIGIYRPITEVSNLYLLLFILLLLMIVCIIERTHYLSELILRMTQNIKDRTHAQLLTYFGGLLIFFDDYANSLIVGGATRELQKKFSISKEKMAFIVDATAAPIAGVAVISSWVGFEIGLFEDIGASTLIGRQGLSMFLDAIPYRFYCMFMLLFVPWLLLSKTDFGPMAEAEAQSLQQSRIHPSTHTRKHKTSLTKLLWVGLSPILLLIVTIFFGFWWDGNQAVGIQIEGSIFQIRYWQTIIGAASHTGQIYVLTSLICLSYVVGLARYTGKPIFRPICIACERSLTPIGIILLAWGLKEFYQELSPTNWVEQMLDSPYLPQNRFFPVFAFVTAAILAATTGTSWGCMSILIPTLIPLIIHMEGEYTHIVILTMSAILDGAILGDHCSPLSDTTILSATATECDLKKHTITQLPYVLLVGTVAIFFGYLLSAYGVSLSTCYLIATLSLATSSYILSQNYATHTTNKIQKTEREKTIEVLHHHHHKQS